MSNNLEPDSDDQIRPLWQRRIGGLEVISLAVLVALPLTASAAMLTLVADFFGGEEVVYERSLSIQSASEVKLLSSDNTPDPKANQGGGDIIISDGALSSAGPFSGDDVVSSNGGQISVHTVRECTAERCETLSHIADMYGVSVNTILWANDIDDPRHIQPGDDLIILPITGVRHIVKSDETLNSIAKKYGGDTKEKVEAMVSDIIDYNRLASASDIGVGETVVVPGGVIHTAAPTKPSGRSTGVTTRVASGGSTTSTSGGLVHPVPGAVRTQGIHGYNAVDLAAAAGTPIRAAAAGEVIASKSGGWNGGYGNYIVIKHSNGTQTLYAHNSSNAVGAGARVTAGETIGYVGNSGRSTGSHLHFEVRGSSNPF